MGGGLLCRERRGDIHCRIWIDGGVPAHGSAAHPRHLPHPSEVSVCWPRASFTANNKNLLLIALALGGGLGKHSLDAYAILSGALPGTDGVYMGIFNFFIVIPEILAALTFGPIVKNWLEEISFTP